MIYEINMIDKKMKETNRRIDGSDKVIKIQKKD
jgi:hypothetical protein